MKIDKRLFTIVNIVISLILVAVLLWYVGIQDVLRDAAKINLLYLLLALFFLFLMDVVMTYRISVLLKDMGIKLKFIEVLICHFIGMLAADFTPARAGYFATAAALKYKYNVPSEKAMLSIFGPQMFDFAAKLIFGAVAAFYLVVYVAKIKEWWVLAIGMAGIGAIIVAMLLMLFSRRFMLLFSFAEKWPYVSKLHAMMLRMQDNSHHVVRRVWFIIGIILLSWTFKAVSWYFVAKSVGITLQVNYPEVLFYFFLQPLVTMLEFIPSVTIAGLGLSEGASVLVLGLFGVPAPQAMLFALVARFKTTLLHLPVVPEALKIYSVK